MAAPRCAYPRCPSRDPNPHPGGLIEEAGDVWRCTACGGLQLACKSPKCQRVGTLNRPFVRWCRWCRQDLVPDPPQLGAAAAWDEARRTGWDRPLVKARDRQEVEVEVVAKLGALPNFQVPTTRIALAMAQGVLALHEAHPRGGILGLLRPLAQSEDNAWIWRETEPASGEAEVPFDPLLLPGGRYLVFARPRRVTVLDLWGCPGLSAFDEQARLRVAELTAWPLAAPPVPLGGQAVGLLSLASGTYRWTVWDLSRPSRSDAELAATPATAPDLLLEGSPCQVELVDDRVLALATPEGHWVWRKDHAAAARVQELSRTWPQPGIPSDRAIDLDEHVLNPRAFHSPRQGFLVNRPGESPRFEWAYRVRGGPDASAWVEQYEVDFTTLETNLPRRVADVGRATPIGPIRPIPFAAEMLFRLGSDLRRETYPCQQHLPKSLAGLRLCDPLLVVIGSGEDGRRRYLQIDSLPHPASPVHVELDGIAADPVVWARWLFTVEGDGRTGLEVRRRKLTPGSGR